jgi:uncharacterized OB-fold protein
MEPTATALTEPFWEATREQRYLIQWCTRDNRTIFYPREVCPTCLQADALEWRDASGRGTVYAVSVQHRAANPTMADRVPYAVALVELEEGPRVMTNVINTPPEDVRVGQSVQLAWEPLSDGRNLPQFEPRPQT